MLTKEESIAGIRDWSQIRAMIQIRLRPGQGLPLRLGLESNLKRSGSVSSWVKVLVGAELVLRVEVVSGIH